MAIQGFGFIGRGRVKREGRAVRPAIRLAIHAVRQELDRFLFLKMEDPSRGGRHGPYSGVAFRS
jgi:hypothetical protein